MRNNYYFTEDLKSSEEIKKGFLSKNPGKETFFNESQEILAKEYNFSFGGYSKESGLSSEYISELYSEDLDPKKFVAILMEEINFLKSNYFNIILSGGRNLAP